MHRGPLNGLGFTLWHVTRDGESLMQRSAMSEESFRYWTREPGTYRVWLAGYVQATRETQRVSEVLTYTVE